MSSSKAQLVGYTERKHLVGPWVVVVVVVVVDVEVVVVVEVEVVVVVVVTAVVVVVVVCCFQRELDTGVYVHIPSILIGIILKTGAQHLGCLSALAPLGLNVQLDGVRKKPSHPLPCRHTKNL